MEIEGPPHTGPPGDAEGVARVPLNHGKEALIDVADLPRVAAHRWYVACEDGRWRAQRGERVEEGGRTRVRIIRMASFILGAPPGVHVAHVNGDGLDNRRANLRLSTPREDGARRRLNRNNTSGYRGVSWHAPLGKWRAGIVRRPLKLHIGYYATAEEAARAYDDKARELFGDGAYQNFPTAPRGALPSPARRNAPGTDAATNRG